MTIGSPLPANASRSGALGRSGRRDQKWAAKALLSQSGVRPPAPKASKRGSHWGGRHALPTANVPHRYLRHIEEKQEAR
jgi:hypothetical protein